MAGSGSRWASFGSAFRSISSQLFGDDLAEELEPMTTTSFERQRQIQRSSQPPDQNRAISTITTTTPSPIHIRSSLEHQPIEHAVTAEAPQQLSIDQLQQSMKELMKHPELWAMYKEELAKEENPSEPETVRSVLVAFLKVHGHKLVAKDEHPKSKPTPTKRASVFHGLNMGLEEESTHVRRQVTTNRHLTHTSSRSKSSQKPNGDRAGDPDVEAQVKNLMQHPHLWAEYKNILSQEASPNNPETVRRVLARFVNEHHVELDSKQNPPARPTDTRRTSIFQALNTDLLGESRHTSSNRPRSKENMGSESRPPAAKGRSSVAQQKSGESDTQRKLRLLRSVPELYTKYQERLMGDEAELDTSATDLLTKFLEEHREELKSLEDAEDEAKQREADEAALLHLDETATLAEERAESSFHQRRNKPISHYGQEHLDIKSEHIQAKRPPQRLIQRADSLTGRESRGVPISFHPVLGDNGTARLTDQASTDEIAEMLSSVPQKLPDSARTVWMDLEDHETGSSDATKEMHSTLSSLVAWSKNFTLNTETKLMDQSFRDGWKKVSSFVAQEMESMTSELETDEQVKSQVKSLTTEDLMGPLSPKHYVERPLHSSMPIRFDAIVEEEEDPLFQEASLIAMRRRKSLDDHSKDTLGVITDVDEDELDVSERITGSMGGFGTEETMVDNSVAPQELGEASIAMVEEFKAGEDIPQDQIRQDDQIKSGEGLMLSNSLIEATEVKSALGEEKDDDNDSLL